MELVYLFVYLHQITETDMSLDVMLYNAKTITCKCGEVHKLDEEIVFNCNITHNLTEMADEAGIYKILWQAYDYPTARDIIETLEAGIKDMKARPSHYRKFDASNGWGTYEDFMPWLDKLLESCKEYPNAIIHISK